MRPMLVSFAGGDVGTWEVERISPVSGAGLPPVGRVAVLEGPDADEPPGAVWLLRGVTSAERYVGRREQHALSAIQPPLGRPEATSGALIPIEKSEEWWELAQDERRGIFEERSHHIARSLAYLPRIARRLHHARDLGEPFDFVTWFEYAPEHASAFEELVGLLRATEEWRYVVREVDIRLRRGPSRLGSAPA
jgi:Chlorite dismutase